MNNKKVNLGMRCVLSIAALFGFSLSASAEEQQIRTIEEVVVTAQRVSQSIQDVPIAVSALDSDDLELKQVEIFSDLQLNAPNLSFTPTQFGSTSVSLRGIGRLSTGISFDQSVSNHLNEAPTRESAIAMELYDLERVEVLRGPQGTLFGRGATAGAPRAIGGATAASRSVASTRDSTT